VDDECRLALTVNTIHFTRGYLNLIQDLIKLYTPFTRDQVTDALQSAFKAQMKHIESSLKFEQQSGRQVKVSFIKKNALFLLDTVLPHAEQQYCEKLAKTSCKAIQKLRQQYEPLKASQNDADASRKAAFRSPPKKVQSVYL